MAGVNVDINARIDRTFSNSLERATRDLNNFRTNAESVGSSLGSIFAKFGAGVSFAGFGALIKSSIDAADNLRDLSRVTKISVEDLAGLKLAANQSGTNLEDVATAINKLSVNIGKSGEKFRELGITSKDPLIAFQQLSDIFKSIDNPQKQAALGATALGKAWATTAPLLLEGGDAIAKMVKEGRDASGVTTQFANEADELNDSIAKLSATFRGFTDRLAGNFAIAANDLIDAFARIGHQAGVLKNTLLGIASFRAGDINDIGNKIEAQQRRVANFEKAGKIRSFFGLDKEGEARLSEEKGKLETLIIERDKILSKLDKKEPTKAGDIDKFIGVKTQKQDSVSRQRSIPRIDNSAAREAQQITESLNQQIKSQERLLVLRNDSTNVAKVEFELFGRILDKNEDIVKLVSSDKNQGQKIRLLNLAAEIDALDRQDEKWQQLIADANEFDRLSESISQLSIDPEINLDKFNAGIAEIQDKLREGIISEDQAKGLFDNLGKGFNEGFVKDAKTSLSTLSTFADEAARNIESSFADFLFDPFKNGLDGMLKGFLDFIRKAAAELAASQVLNLLVGKDKGGKGGIVQGILGSIFHDGGIVGQDGGSRIINPIVFAGAKRFHDGGFPGLAQNEVPAILQKGELVLTKSQQQNIGASDSIVNNIVINVQSNGRESLSDQGNKIAESFIRALAREEIKTANRPGNVLKPVTSF